MAVVTVIGLMSTWREGDLARGAYRSLKAADLDAVIVCEGLAGPQPDDWQAMPETALTPTFSGSWGTDAAKLTEMLTFARERYDRPLWGLWLAADELLVNGELLRDFLQRVQWEDERQGRHILKPDNGPTFSVPLTQVEHDGSLGRVLSRVVRLDLIRRYVVSSHVIELVTGQVLQHGARPLTLNDLPQMMALEAASKAGPDADRLCEEIGGRVFVPPIFAGEPYTIHRPHLRHPARQAVRMYEQEDRELERLGLPR
jgi:hypothetical protein